MNRLVNEQQLGVPSDRLPARVAEPFPEGIDSPVG